MNITPFLCHKKNDDFSKRQKERQKIDAEITAVLDQLQDRPERRAAFERLLRSVRSHTELLKPGEGKGVAGWLSPVFLIRRLKNLAERQAHWIRPVEMWRPAGTSLRPAFRSLAHHLLAFYPVPGFMDSAWDLNSGPEGFRQQAWFIRLGRGASLRALDIPLPLTRRMEHFVRRAPDHYTVWQALRYGEVRGLGGSEKLAREVAIGRLGQSIEHTEFWRTGLIFLVAHTDAQLENVNPIIDFIQSQKFGGEEAQTEHGRTLRTAPWPEFSMKGRTLKSLLRLVTAWHADLASNRAGKSFSWRASPIAGYRFLERRDGDDPDREWTIQELTDSGALHAEGKAMRHCVYSYAERCRRGVTTIWSLRLRINENQKRIVTIEVDPHRRSIVQARAKCNSRPGGRSSEIIRRWINCAGLGCDLAL